MFLAAAIAGAAAGALAGLPSHGASAEPPHIDEFVITQESEPHSIVAGSDGNLWFTEEAGSRVGRMTTAGVWREFSTRTLGATPGGIAQSHTTRIYWTEAGVSRLGWIDPPAGPPNEHWSGGISDGAGMYDIALKPASGTRSARMWFTEPGIDKIARLNPVNAQVEEFTLPAGSDPHGIVTGPDDNVWFTEYSHGAIGRITDAGVVTHYTLDPGSAPEAITVGPDGNLWFTDRAEDSIGRITPQGVGTEFSTGITPYSQPMDIAAGPDGNLWFTEYGSSPPRIGRITTSGVVTEFPGGTGVARGIAAGPDGNIWFTEPTVDRIGRLVPPLAPQPGPQPPPPEPPTPEPPTPEPAGLAPPKLTVVGAKTVTRGGRARFAYRITNPNRSSLTRILVVNSLPRGLAIDAVARTANRTVKKALRFAAAGRKVTFRIGTIAAGRTVVVRVNARVLATATKGRRMNSIRMSASGLTATTVTWPLRFR